jgi:hypothetical protein
MQDMTTSTISAADLQTFEAQLADVVRQMSSIDDLKRWISAQPYVESISVPPYMIETLPPQRELSILFKMDDGSKRSRTVDVMLCPDQTLRLASVHDQS